MENPEIKTIKEPMWQLGSFLNNQLTQRIFCLVTFTFIFIFHTSPLELSDLWWHLNTGRWMWANGGLPTDDPFLFTSASPMDARASLILLGFPLAQLLFFGAYSLAGTYALVALQGLLSTLFYGLLWSQFRQHKLHPILASAIVGVLPVLFFRFVELRPQWFSFIGALLVIQLAENILANERRGNPPRKYVLLLLPATMFLWANLHRGYIIGIGILFVYLISEWIARKKGKAALSDGAYRRFLYLSLFSVAIAFLNPAGITAIWASFTELSGPFPRVIDEYRGTVKYFESFGLSHIGYIIVAAAAIPALALFLKWREVGIAHLLLVALFLAAGIMSFRFSLMMVAVILSIACAYFARELNGWLTRAKGIPMILLWCASTWFLASNALSRTCIPNSPLGIIIPSAAVDYLAQTQPKGNIYNYAGYGGYLSWRLYPQKVFIDQRCLSWDTYDESTHVWNGRYSEIFHKHQVGVVIAPIINFSTRRRSKLVTRLLDDGEWAVGYYDKVNVVFMRQDINSHLNFLNKQVVAEDVLQRLNRRGY